MANGKQEAKAKKEEDNDSEQETEGQLEYIERKEDKPKEEDKAAVDKDGKKGKDESKEVNEKGNKANKTVGGEAKKIPPNGSKDKSAKINNIDKNQKGGIKKTEKPNTGDKKADETEQKEEEKERTLAQEMKDAMLEKKVDSDQDGPSSMYERHFKKQEYSIWSLDCWFYGYLSNWNSIIPCIIEILIVGIILFLPSIFWLIKERANLDLKKFFSSPGPLKVGDPESLFRFALFTFLWYSFDSIVSLICDSLLLILNTILALLFLNESEFVWSIVASIFGLRRYLRAALSCIFASFLTTKMFSPFTKPKSFDVFNIDTYKVLLFWFGLYSALHFIFKFILGICVYDLKRASYKEAIWDLNHKIFIFKKLSEIGKASNQSERDDICANRIPSFDPGFYLKDRDFFLSEEDAKIVSNNILVSLNKKKLTIDDIKVYFPPDPENIFKYFNGSLPSEEASTITATAFMKRAKELYLKRKDMQKTLIDRDYIFDMLESLVSLLVFYIAAILLCFLFDIDYNFYLFGLGSSLLAFSWVFADTIKKIFICFVFVLLVRPYDIGDRVMINTETLKVHKVNLLHSTFLNKNKSIVYLSNDILFNTPIVNYARSNDQCIEVEVTPENVVTLDAAKKLEENAQNKIKEIPKHFTSLELTIKSDSKISFMIYMKKNLQDENDHLKRKNILMKVFDKALSEAGITHKSSYIFNP